MIDKLFMDGNFCRKTLFSMTSSSGSTLNRVLTICFQFEQQQMIDNGANPFIVSYSGKTKFEINNLSRLSNLPTQKSVYFTTRQIVGESESIPDFPDPWFYKTGVFDGKFDSLIGQGASGTVISGELAGRKAAFKFVPIGSHKYQKRTAHSLKTLDDKLSEMTSIQSTRGSKIVKFFGHFR